MLTPVKHTENQTTKPTAMNDTFFRGESSVPFFQAKLTVNTPSDAPEREADAAADQVMRMKVGDAPIVQRMPLTAVSYIQRACANCDKEKDGIQCNETSGGDASGKAAPSVVSDVLSSGGGQPMESGTRQFMESRFGQDFSQVRIHTDSRAAESASAIQARAYTSGRNVVFGSGEYQPSSEAGQRLLAHELVHVGQQGGTPSVQRACDKNEWNYEYDGCSLPAAVTKAIGVADKDNPGGGEGTQFSNIDRTGACDQHDRCYQTCGSNQQKCDREMYDNMIKTCHASQGAAGTKERCLKYAETFYYKGLRLAGWTAHPERQAQVCSCEKRDYKIPDSISIKAGIPFVFGNLEVEGGATLTIFQQKELGGKPAGNIQPYAELRYHRKNQVFYIKGKLDLGPHQDNPPFEIPNNRASTVSFSDEALKRTLGNAVIVGVQITF